MVQLVVAVLALGGCGGDPAADPVPPPAHTREPAPTPDADDPARPLRNRPPTVRPSNAAHRIPDAFPLLAGLPPVDGDGSTWGPSRVLAPLVPSACGRRVPVPQHVDLLRGAWNEPEDSRERQLVSFRTDRAAAAYADALLDLYRACPEDRIRGGDRLRSMVVDSDLSRHAGAVSVLATHGGAPRPGLETLHVVRLGQHVLLALTYGEGGAGPDPEAEAAAHRSADAAALAEVVDSMGTLDNAGDRPWFGPRGYGDVRLGMSRERLEALPHARVDRPARCATFRVRVTDAGIEPGVSGIVERGRGVTSMALAAPSSTPEGVGVGAAYRDVLLAYPRAEGDRQLLTVDVPRHPDRYYRFELGPDGVASLLLVRHDQHCAG